MMNALAALHVERPLWLLALVPAAALWLLARRGSDPAQQWRSVIDPALLPYLLTGGDQRVRIPPADWLFAAMALAAAAIAGPAWQREPSPFAEAKPTVAIVLRVTPSMLTEDLAPTRLDRARQKLADILAAREGASTALIAYAGSAHLVLPPTPDSAVILDLAKALSPEIMPKQGDDLAGALALARRALAGIGQGGAILLLADEALPGSVESQPAGSPPLTILALRDAESAGLAEVEKTLGGTVVPTTPDQADVAAIVRRLDRGDNAAGIAGEGDHWSEAGYWLVPILALLALPWFRRGWGVA